jgi:hypothetical protein
MPEAMATRLDAGRLGIALHLLLNRFHRQGLLDAFAIPKDIALRLPLSSAIISSAPTYTLLPALTSNGIQHGTLNL